MRGLQASVSVVVMAVAWLGCAEDVPITTEPGRMHRELSEQQSYFGDWIDMTLVLSADERADAVEPVVALVSHLITGDSDADGVADHYALPILRVAVLTPEEAAAWDACEDDSCPARPKVAAYRHYPYGFAPSSTDPFLEDVRCLLSEDTSACDDNGAAFGVLSDFDPSVGGEQFRLTLDDIISLRDGTAFDERFLACNAHFLPWGGFGWDLDQIRRLDDGLADCELLETLPPSGPITRCDQLTDFGRTLDHVAADGREVCLMRQVPIDDGGEPPTGYGYYCDPIGDTAMRMGQMTFPTAAPQFAWCGGANYYGDPTFAFTRDTPPIPGTTITLTCAFNVAE